MANFLCKPLEVLIPVNTNHSKSTQSLKWHLSISVDRILLCTGIKRCWTVWLWKSFLVFVSTSYFQSAFSILLGKFFMKEGKAFRLCEVYVMPDHLHPTYIPSTPGEGNWLFVCESGSPYQEEHRQRKHGCLMWSRSTDEELPTWSLF